MTDANANPGPDTVTFAGAGASGTISLLTALPELADEVTITGPGATALTVRRDPGAATNFRIFTEVTATVNIAGLTLTGGYTNQGGAILVGGTVGAPGTVTIDNCAIIGNTGYDGNYGAGGGAIRVDLAGHLTVMDSTLANNIAAGVGGAVNVYSNGSLTIMNSTVAGNMCGGIPSYGRGGGGGIYFANQGQLLMENCTVSGNRSDGGGGGLYFGSHNPTGNSWIIANSTISGNSTARVGGGLAFQTLNDTLQIQNSTVTGNSSAMGGGGIWIPNDYFGNSVDLESSIVSGNNSGTSPDLNIPGATNTTNAIKCAIGDPNGFTFSGSSSGNLPYGANLNLGPLQNNGGPTETEALLPGSPCIGAGSNPAGLATDQRGPGFPRVIGTATDIGAYEAGGAPRVESTVVNDGSAQRSEVRTIQVTFSGPVTFVGGNANAAAAFQLNHIQTGNNVILSAAVATDAMGRTVVSFGFSGPETDPVSARNGGVPSLADGRYRLTVLSNAVTGANGLALDGDADGAPGGNYVSPADTFHGSGLHLYRLFGDVNGDGV
ncbi:MAG TPA: choice-of-anchor Q domain-containing protein, partial [Gemmataceae bacterium]|nr:choice-of-anchor Q domain-containing protein [Gemmataceae bacterium]